MVISSGQIKMARHRESICALWTPWVTGSGSLYILKGKVYFSSVFLWEQDMLKI